MTLLFKAKFTYGNAAANDDLNELKWFDLNELNEEDLVDEHKPLLKILLLNLKK